MELWWDLILETGMTSKVCHTSQPEPTLSSPDALLQMSGMHARTEETNLVSASNKLFSLDVSGLTPELVFMLVLTILTMLLPHWWTRSSRLITDTVKMINISHLWTIINSNAHHSQLMKIRWLTPLESELLETSPLSHSVPLLLDKRDSKLRNLLPLLLVNSMENLRVNITLFLKWPRKLADFSQFRAYLFWFLFAYRVNIWFIYKETIPFHWFWQIYFDHLNFVL